MSGKGEGLHILIANNIYPPIMAGGAELIVQYLAEGLAGEGHRVTVVSTCGPEMEPYPVESRNGVDVIRFFPRNLYWHWTRGSRSGYQKALWHLRDAWNRDAGKRFRAILQERKPDIVHTHLMDGFSGILWRRARQHGIPTVHTAHDYHLLCPRAMLLDRSLKLCTKPKPACRIFRKWHLHTARDIDIFCSPSRFLLEQHEKAGLAVTHRAVVRNGIPLHAKAQTVKAEGEPFRFLFAARLTPEKGCRVLIEAMKHMPREMHFTLDIAGTGPLEHDLRAAAQEDSRIRLLGYVQGDAKKEAFQSADCLILPSLWYENAPVVIIEAAAYDLAVIGSRIGAIPEFITHDETGLLFESGDPASLADAMQRMINENHLSSRLAANAQRLIKESSVLNMVKEYLGQYAIALRSK